jgi:hypothetical protein
MTIRNLFTIKLEEQVAPKQVMLDQVQHLSELSAGTISAVVETSRGNPTQSDFLVHTFRVVVPTLGYSFKLFEVTHSADIYPVKVSNGDWTFERECDDFDSFVESVSEILNETSTKRRLESLKCQVVAESRENESGDSSQRQERVTSVPSVSSSPLAQPDEASADESTEEDSPSEAYDVFDEWTKIEFNGETVDAAPATRGGAVIYSAGGSPAFIAYSATDIQSVLRSQLRKKSGPGVLFECGTGDSQDDIESMVKNKVGAVPFRSLRAGPDTSVWP